MRKEQGFSLIELLIVVAIIAIIAAIAVPSMLQARMAANESGAVQGCRTVGSAEVAHSAINNQSYAALADLVTRGFLDSRFTGGFNGYDYADGAVTTTDATALDVAVPTGFGVTATPQGANTGRYTYGIGPDQVVRYQSGGMLCGAAECAAGSALGSSSGS
jgi:prepilin-type N-terminal cleavage/methylation domain-containing protein